MGDFERRDGRLAAARSPHRRLWSFAASGPGIRVIELDILAIRVQVLSINMGRGRPPVSSYWSPANAGLRRVDRTVTIERRHSFAKRCGRTDLIKHSQRLRLLSEMLKRRRSPFRRRSLWPVPNRKVTP